MVDRPFRTEFAAVLTPQLYKRRVNQSWVATKTGATQVWISRMMTGNAPVSSEWVERIAQSIDATAEERQLLHRAAARDRGYRID